MSVANLPASEGNQAMTAQPIHDEPVAAVKTLTAEVRTVMMNNRQVTLSVARQLDCVDFFDMEPWGRIELGKTERRRDEWEGLVEVSVVSVIGQCDGTLVTAMVPDVDKVRRTYLHFEVGDGQVLYSCDRADGPRRTLTTADGVRVYVVGRIRSHRDEGRDRCRPWECTVTASDAETSLRFQLALAAHKGQIAAQVEKVERALALPKIVLAGLK